MCWTESGRWQPLGGPKRALGLVRQPLPACCLRCCGLWLRQRGRAAVELGRLPWRPRCCRARERASRASRAPAPLGFSSSRARFNCRTAVCNDPTARCYRKQPIARAISCTLQLAKSSQPASLPLFKPSGRLCLTHTAGSCAARPGRPSNCQQRLAGQQRAPGQQRAQPPQWHFHHSSGRSIDHRRERGSGCCC